jgi:RNA polymerase sigma factor (sigma-70 family)
MIFEDILCPVFVGWPPPPGVIIAMRPELLGRLVDDHAAVLQLYARQWCDAPEDVVQEAFIKLAGQRPEPDNPTAWLYCVVRNGALSVARAARRRRHHETYAAARHPAWFEPSDGIRLDADDAARALGALPLDQREVIVAHLWGGLTFEQIGELAGVSTSTAHRRYLAGLAALRERLRVPWPNKTTTRI